MCSKNGRRGCQRSASAMGIGEIEDKKGGDGEGVVEDGVEELIGEGREVIRL